MTDKDFTQDERRWIDAVVEVLGLGSDLELGVNDEGVVRTRSEAGELHRAFPLDRAIAIFVCLSAAKLKEQAQRREQMRRIAGLGGG